MNLPIPKQLKLRRILTEIGRSQAQLAASTEFSSATICQLINHRLWPRTSPKLLREQIVNFLQSNGATAEQVSVAFEEETPPQVSAAASGQPLNGEDEHMSVRKQILLPSTLKHFKLVRNPFDEVNSADEFYANEQIRYLRAQLLDACKRGGFVALYGESGSGKTTLRRDLLDRIKRDELQIQVIQPFVIGMEASDEKGKTLKAAHIVESIMSVIAPHEQLRASSEARYRQLQRALAESYRTGMRHVVLIEEAHALPKATLRHFKRFLEIEDGFARLLSVILIGQTELAQKLSPQDASVREVVQRCELVQLPPLGEHLESYVAFRLRSVDATLDQVITPDGLQALQARLDPADIPRGHDRKSMLYPLAVNNLLTACMNEAAAVGSMRVSADVVKETKWN